MSFSLLEGRHLLLGTSPQHRASSGTASTRGTSSTEAGPRRGSERGTTRSLDTSQVQGTPASTKSALLSPGVANGFGTSSVTASATRCVPLRPPSMGSGQPRGGCAGLATANTDGWTASAVLEELGVAADDCATPTSFPAAGLRSFLEPIHACASLHMSLSLVDSGGSRLSASTPVANSNESQEGDSEGEDASSDDDDNSEDNESEHSSGSYTMAATRTGGHPGAPPRAPLGHSPDLPAASSSFSRLAQGRLPSMYPSNSARLSPTASCSSPYRDPQRSASDVNGGLWEESLYRSLAASTDSHASLLHTRRPEPAGVADSGPGAGVDAVGSSSSSTCYYMGSVAGDTQTTAPFPRSRVGDNSPTSLMAPRLPQAVRAHLTSPVVTPPGWGGGAEAVLPRSGTGPLRGFPWRHTGPIVPGAPLVSGGSPRLVRQGSGVSLTARLGEGGGRRLTGPPPLSSVEHVVVSPNGQHITTCAVTRTLSVLTVGGAEGEGEDMAVLADRGGNGSLHSGDLSSISAPWAEGGSDASRDRQQAVPGVSLTLTSAPLPMSQSLSARSGTLSPRTPAPTVFKLLSFKKQDDGPILDDGKSHRRKKDKKSRRGDEKEKGKKKDKEKKDKDKKKRKNKDKGTGADAAAAHEAEGGGDANGHRDGATPVTHESPAYARGAASPRDLARQSSLLKPGATGGGTPDSGDVSPAMAGDTPAGLHAATTARSASVTPCEAALLEADGEAVEIPKALPPLSSQPQPRLQSVESTTAPSSSTRPVVDPRQLSRPPAPATSSRAPAHEGNLKLPTYSTTATVRRTTVVPSAARPGAVAGRATSASGAGGSRRATATPRGAPPVPPLAYTSTNASAAAAVVSGAAAAAAVGGSGWRSKPLTPTNSADAANGGVSAPPPRPVVQTRATAGRRVTAGERSVVMRRRASRSSVLIIDGEDQRLPPL